MEETYKDRLDIMASYPSVMFWKCLVIGGCTPVVAMRSVDWSFEITQRSGMRPAPGADPDKIET